MLSFKKIVIQCKYIFLFILPAALITGCAFKGPPQFDPATNHFKSDVKLTDVEVTTKEAIRLDQYKMFLIVGSAHNYLPKAIQSMNVFKNIQTSTSISTAFEKSGNDTEAAMQITSTQYGVQQLTKLYGKILVLEIKIYGIGDVTLNMFFKVYDASTGKIYFSAHYLSVGLIRNEATLFNPLLNAFADWIKQNKSSIKN